jgi:hypothetical protein
MGSKNQKVQNDILLVFHIIKYFLMHELLIHMCKLWIQKPHSYELTISEYTNEIYCIYTLSNHRIINASLDNTLKI